MIEDPKQFLKRLQAGFQGYSEKRFTTEQAIS